jgi:hypothetical protein
MPRITEQTNRKNAFVDKKRSFADSVESSMSSAVLATIIGKAIASNQMRTTGSMMTAEMTFQDPTSRAFVLLYRYERRGGSAPSGAYTYGSPLHVALPQRLTQVHE